MLSNVPARFAHEAAGMRIDRDNVLRAGAVIAAEANRLQEALSEHGKARAGLCGGDPVSRDAAAAFNERADALVEAQQKYVDDLFLLSDSVANAARAYGIAEHEIRDSLRR